MRIWPDLAAGYSRCSHEYLVPFVTERDSQITYCTCNDKDVTVSDRRGHTCNRDWFGI